MTLKKTDEPINTSTGKKRLHIDPRGGMAGDMFAAGLISAGADYNRIHEAMTAAGQELGQVKINHKIAPDGASQLDIQLDSKRHHLGGNEGRQILANLFQRFKIEAPYIALGEKILEILIAAEIRAHAEFNIVISSHHHSHSHSHHHTHETPENLNSTHSHHHTHHHHHHPTDEEHHHHHHGSERRNSNHNHSHKPNHGLNNGHNHGHNHGHSHGHSHPEKEEAFLHEAQDIIIDIMGTVTGMQLLNLEPEIQLTDPISVGGGHVHCSHGTLDIPAPATSIILEEYKLPWKKGPLQRELFTPTGAAILAALGARLTPNPHRETTAIPPAGISRGTKILDIEPLKFFVYQ